MDLDNQHQEGNPSESLPQRKPLSRQQRYRLNKKLRQQQAQSSEAQNNQPQGNQSEGNRPLGKNNAKNKRQRQRKRLQRQQAENSKAQNGQPQPAHPQRNLPQDGQHQNSQPQHNQPQNGQRQGKAPQGNKPRNDQPRNKVLEEPPAWFGRVSQWNAEKPSVWKKTLDEVLQEENDLSDWECNCSKEPKNCKCKQAQIFLHGEMAALNKDFLKYQEHRNGLKRDLRIEAYEEAEEMKEMVQAEKAKVSEIQAAIRGIKKSETASARIPIGIRGCVYDLHCVELYQLLADAQDREGNEIAFFEDWETKEGTDDFDPPLRPEYTRSYGPSGYTPGTKLFAFVTLNDVVYDEPAWCSNPFSGPEYAGRCIIRRYGGENQGENMEITFHNSDYLELKVYAKTVLGFCDGDKTQKEKFNDYFKNAKDQKKNQCFHFYGVRRKGTPYGSSEEGSEDGSEEGCEEEFEEGSGNEYEQDSEEEYEEETVDRAFKQYPPWFYRVFRYEQDRFGTERQYDAVPGWIFDEDLSDWECDCNKDPEDCKCWQPQLKMRAGVDELDEKFCEVQKDRNKRKRDLRIKRFNREKAEAEGPRRTPTWLFLEHKIAKASQIQAATRDIENSNAPRTKTPISINCREYDLYCPELCRLVNRDGVLMDESLYFVDTWWVDRVDKRRLDSHYDYLDWMDKTPEYTEKNLCAFMFLGQLRSKSYYSKPFLNPRYTGRYNVGCWGLEDADIEITFHSQDYLEVKLHANAIRRNFGYGNPGLEERLADYFQLDTPYLRWYGVLRTPEREIALIEEEHRLKDKYRASIPPLQAFR
ncbi:hypothetical protein GCG54_00006327 [Colletotrichum gloeosporioides]|uniref:Uncharacterized protein n=1 Tax=Colletotrichum gloeosporioides TaxID=474922 RepID=A0A8H4CRG2_COLGL|nr:uncharacterized protein GCG54_00006327 [Colletotrichum gloeosporioides]KAF3808467.1 hypothetical protein GCG54_00006327 [Colletotrichum gloeosporioides]